MGYIMDLRKKVGNMPLIHCASSVIVENSAGRILLQLRKDNRCWAEAGGSVEIDERVEDAAVRELFEETGLRALSLELLCVASGPEQHYTYPHGDEVSNISIVYVCRQYEGELKAQDDEVLDMQFFDIEQLPEKINPPSRLVIQKYLEYRKTRLH